MRKNMKGLIVAFTALASLLTTGVAYAYNQAEYTGNGQPQLNTYTSVEGWGNEKDFLRVGAAEDKFAAATDKRNVCEGEFKIFVYVHNGAPEGYNGDNNNGTGVAKDVRVKVNVPQASGKVQSLSSVVSASNAASVNDTTTISCDTDDIQLEYIPGSAENVSLQAAKRAVNDSIVTAGAQIGTNANDGIVPGCWDFRNYVTLKVRVKKVSKPVVKLATCDLLDATIKGRELTINKINYTLNDAKLTGASINFGDGKNPVSLDITKQLPYKYTFDDKDAEYTVAVTLKTDKGDVPVSGCSVKVKVSTTKVLSTTVVKSLPKTGAGDMVGMFAAVTVAGAVAHRFVLSRRSR